MSYVTSFEEVLWGIALVALTMVIHGCGMLATLVTTHRFRPGNEDTPAFVRSVGVLIMASWMIVLVHLVELLIWAAFFLWQDAMPNSSTSYYFALMQYTTVGSGYSLPPRWRLLDGMLPIAGLMTFAWSTGVLFTLAQEYQTRQAASIHGRLEARRSRRWSTSVD